MESKGIGWLLVLVFLLKSAALWAGPVTIMTVNDLHSALFPSLNSKSEGALQEESGGIGRMASVFNAAKEAGPGQVLVVTAGNFTEGPVFFYFDGDAEIAALNALGFDVGTLGNHEFDRGIQGVEKYGRELNFPLISSNLKFHDPALQEKFNRRIVKVWADGTKVGIFGLMAPELEAVSQPQDVAQVQVVQDIKAVARRELAAFRGQGCQVITALTHIGFDRDQFLVSQVKGLNAVIGGHTHTEVREMVLVEDPGGALVLVVQAGSKGRYVGRLRLEVRDQRTIADTVRWDLVELNSQIPLDGEVQVSVEPYREKLQDQLGQAIAFSEDTMDAYNGSTRCGESNLGSFLADAMAWYLRTDIAFVNGGNIRGDCIYPDGPISYLRLYEISPWGNTLSKTSMTGSQIWEFQEISASAAVAPGDGYHSDLRTPTGGFMQFSGLRVTFDLSQPPALIDNAGTLQRPGKRIQAVEVLGPQGAYEPIDLQKNYSVALLQWTVQGGDKYYLGPHLDSLDSYVVDREVTAAYLTHLGGWVKMPALGRMIFR